MISLFGALQEGFLEEMAFIKPDDIVDYGAKDLKAKTEGCWVMSLEK